MNSISLNDFTIWFPAAAFLAGIAAFSHCALMCGPINILFRKNIISYQAGRITGYTSTGMLLGFFGPILDRAGILLSLQNFSIYITGIILVVYVFSLFIPAGINFPVWPGLLKIMSALQRENYITGSFAAASAGILTALIPCSMLYPVWILAASSGSYFEGGIISFSFAAGTIPALFVIQFMANRGISMIRIKSKLFRILSVIILTLLSLGMLYFRYSHSSGFRFSDSSGEMCTENK